MSENVPPYDQVRNERHPFAPRKAEVDVDADRLDLVMEATSEGLWDWNLCTNDVYFSPRWKEMIGYAEDEVAHRFEEWERRVHPDDLPLVQSAIADYLSGASANYEVEHRMQHKDGTYRWICARGVVTRNADGQAKRLVGSHADITDRKAAEHALRRSRRQVQDLVNAIDGIVWEADVSPMQITFVSEQAARLSIGPLARESHVSAGSYPF